MAEGDKVATRWRAQGTHRGPFAGGRLAERWEAINLLPLLRQLGAIG